MGDHALHAQELRRLELPVELLLLGARVPDQVAPATPLDALARPGTVADLHMREKIRIAIS